MEKSVRTLPPRGALFTSKYANRTGHGLPIFTTERALERQQVGFIDRSFINQIELIISETK